MCCGEHDICLKQLDTSALEEHCKTNNQALFDSVKILAQMDNNWERVIREASEISVDCTAVNKDNGIMLSQMDGWMGLDTCHVVNEVQIRCLFMISKLPI